LLESWEKRDPVMTYRARLLEAGVSDEAVLSEIAQRVGAEVADAVARAEADTLPDPATVEAGVYAEG
jgi:TPP-dependent pyruvate/acetoin dehydrogenase alpha subunit